MYKALFQAENAAFIQGAEQMFNIPLRSGKEFPNDITIDELKVYRDMGGFRSEWAGIMEVLIRYTEESSDWRRNIGKNHIADIAMLNMYIGK